jgi:hypothetical protein
MNEETASCHRTNHHKFDTTSFNFHNTPSKIEDRERMLNGEWPERGCNYCRNIESAGGQSDRMTNLDFPGIHAPHELDANPQATVVTPRILEVYFDNTCNLKCVYCGPHFSSLWAAENKKYGAFRDGVIIEDDYVKSKNIDANKQRLFAWLTEHGKNLSQFNILGGEPLYQSELEECLRIFQQHPAPELKLQIFTNLNTKIDYLDKIVTKVKSLIDTGCLREFEVTASLDCWGEAQEYVRWPLDLAVWEQNFEYLLDKPWINLIISSTVTPLTIKTLPDLLEKINRWNDQRPVYHYQNSVNGMKWMFIDIFGPLFREDFEQALALKPERTPEERASKEYLAGIAQQANSSKPNPIQIKNLYDYLNELDRRRGSCWKTTFPWLVEQFGRFDATNIDINRKR